MSKFQRINGYFGDKRETWLDRHQIIWSVYRKKAQIVILVSTKHPTNVYNRLNKSYLTNDSVHIESTISTHARICGFTQFKLMLFRDQLYILLLYNYILLYTIHTTLCSILILPCINTVYTIVYINIICNIYI